MYQYVHYGAFSKNKSLDSKWKVYLYRKVVLLSHRGLLRFDRKSFVNRVIRIIFTKLQHCIFGRMRLERNKYQF